MMMKIYVDCREHQLISLFSENNLQFEQKQLDIGDVLITDENDKVYCIIERKTVKDMIASVKDGRYREQKHRLLLNFNKKNIIYLIEDFYSFMGLNNKSAESAIIHSLFRDEIKHIFSRNINDTFFIIQSIFSRVIAHPEYFQVVGGELGDEGEGKGGEKYKEVGYFSMNSIKKSNNMCHESINMSLFCQIPGVSQQSASSLCNHYGSFANMIVTLKGLTSDEDKMNELNTIKVNGRKMNKNIVKGILEFVV